MGYRRTAVACGKSVCVTYTSSMADTITQITVDVEKPVAYPQLIRPKADAKTASG